MPDESINHGETNKYREISDGEVQRVLGSLKKSYQEIENLRQKNNLVEPHGAIKPNGEVKWFSAPERWEGNKVDYRPSEKAKRSLAEKGWVFFHCHPNSLGNIASIASANDRAGTPYNIFEAIFHDKGITLLVARRIYPLNETEEIIRELKEKSPLYADLYGDEYWAFDGLISEKFAIQTIEISKDNWTI